MEIVSDAMRATEAIKTRPIGGAVVDAELVGIEGLDVLGAIRNLDPAPPVIVTGPQDRPELERLVRRAGAAAYVSKPCAPAQVAEALCRSISAGITTTPRRRPSLSLAVLEPGQVLLIECLGGPIEGRLSTKLLAKHPTSLAIAVPRRQRESVMPPLGVRVRVGFPLADGWYQFETHVLGAASHRGEQALLLAQPKLVTHIQRRRYARTRAAFDVELGAEHDPVAGRGQDACEGGIRVLTERPLSAGSAVPCRIEAGAGERISLAGTVIWTHELRDNGCRYRTGMEFSTPSAADQERLRAWIERLGRPGEGADDRSHPTDSFGFVIES